MIAGIVTDLTDWLDRISSNWWFLVIIFAIAFFDSVIPVVPSETCVIIGGVAAGLGNQNLVPRHRCGAVGAFLGDNTAFLIGLRCQRMVQTPGRAQAEVRPQDELGATTDPRARRAAADHRPVHPRRPNSADAVVRHHPPEPRRGSCVGLRSPCVIWATYAAMLGRIGGEAFKDDHTKAFLFAFGLAMGTTA